MIDRFLHKPALSVGEAVFFALIIKNVAMHDYLGAALAATALLSIIISGAVRPRHAANEA